MQDLAADPDAVRRLYERDPERFRCLIESDVTAEDLVAIEYRRRGPPGVLAAASASIADKPTTSA